MIYQLKIHHPSVHPDAKNYSIESWPPGPDFPIVVNSDNAVISRFGDEFWDLSIYSKRCDRVRFEGGRRNTRFINHENANELRLLVAWWMYGPRPPQSAGTIVAFGNLMRLIFAKCTEANIVGSRLSRHPRVISDLARSCKATACEHLLLALHELHEWRDDLGMTILDKAGLRQFAAESPKRNRRQTPYIPPRIWSYQVSRLRQFLEDYSAHQAKIEDCFKYCLDAYKQNFGSIERARDPDREAHRAPFRKTSSITPGCTYFGTFWKTASEFGIGELLRRWNGSTAGKSGERMTITAFSNYLTLTGHVGTGYLTNFSGMRIDESLRLRASCLQIERDPQLGPIFFLKGSTTKTIDDKGALWVTSSSVGLAVEVLKHVALLRLSAGVEDPLSGVKDEDLVDPPLRVRTYEPWATRAHEKLGLEIRPSQVAYGDMLWAFPRLFEADKLQITREDLDIARLVTPSLDAKKYHEGAIWHLTWHQLRRSVAVNMTGSGLVSDLSLQYQLKHLVRAMSLYYARGYSHLSLNREFKAEYIRTIYEMLHLQFAKLQSERYVSPYGETHKMAKLKALTPTDVKGLVASAKKGLLSFRETLLGGCLKNGPCPHGGIDNLVECGGGRNESPCPEAIFDREKHSRMLALKRDIEARATLIEPNAPERESLAAQLRSVELAINSVS